jgi:hypothetical protein
MMLVSAMVFIGLLAYYCTSLKKEEEPVDPQEAIINELLAKY